MQVLILAMTKMLSGICTAGLTTESDPVTGLRWVRPVKESGTLLLGDMTTKEGQVIGNCDIVDLCLLKPRPDPPHVEDWVSDFVFQRPRRLRQLADGRRAAFFERYLDRAPQDVLVAQRRSLCLIRPDAIRTHFALDAYSASYRARMDVTLGDLRFNDLPVTDIKWRALGRSWLGAGGQLLLPADELQERLALDAIYLALGLSRGYRGRLWPLVIGVHTVPDYEVDIDYGRL